MPDQTSPAFYQEAEFFEKFQSACANFANGVVGAFQTREATNEQILSVLYDEHQKMFARVEELYRLAAAAGNAEEARIWNAIAVDQAQVYERLRDTAVSVETRLEGYTGRLRYLASLSGEFVGASFDIGAVASAIYSGDGDKAGEGAISIALASLFGAGAVILAPAVASATAVALAGGVAAVVGASLAEDFNRLYGRPFFDTVGKWIPDSWFRAVDDVIYGEGSIKSDPVGGAYVTLLVGRMDSDFSRLELGQLFDAAATARVGRESVGVLNHLAVLFGISDSVLPEGASQDDLVAFAGRIADAARSIEGDLKIRVGPTLASEAKTDFGKFLALNFLSPISLSGKSDAATTFLETTHEDLARFWKADLNARLYGDTEYEFSYSDQWFEDRVALLHAISLRNQQDVDTGQVFDAQAKAGQVTFFDFVDPVTGRSTVLSTLPSGVSGLPEQHVTFGSTKAETITGFNNKLGDHLYGDGGNDTVSGLAGDDYLEGQLGDDELSGGSDHDTLLGGSGNDTLRGDDGHDTLLGGEGNDNLDGGAGNDGLYGGTGSDAMVGGEGNDLLHGGAGSDTLTGGVGRDYLIDEATQAETSVMSGGDGSDLLDARQVQGRATLEGGIGSDWIRGGGGINSIQGGDGADWIEGGAQGDFVLGGDGADQVVGNAGNDSLAGGGGADFLSGGQGNDTYLVELNGGADLIDDQVGQDLLLFPIASSWNATYDEAKAAWVTSDGYVIRKHTLGTGTTTTLAIYKDGDKDNTVYLRDWSAGQFGIQLNGEEVQPQAPAGITPQPLTTREDNNYVDHAINNDAADGGQGNDILQATDAQSVLAGGVGNDILDGRGGNDWLDGGENNDIILSGAGKDTAYGGSGNDVMRAGYVFDMAVGFTVPEGEPALFYQAGSSFAGQLTAGGTTTSAFTYRYRHADGTITNEPIPHPELARFDITVDKKWDEQTQSFLYFYDVGDGAKLRMEPSLTLTLTLGDPLDVKLGQTSGHAPDEVGLAKTYVLRLGQAPDVLAAGTGAEGVRFWGGAGEDIIYGANDNDKLYGEADGDVLIGYDGDDELLGGDGVDYLWGGDGRDFLDGGIGNDARLVGGYGSDVIYGGGDDDSLFGDSPYLIGTNWYPPGEDTARHGDDYLDGGTGNDKIWGDFGDDFIYGGDGDDYAFGGAGDDYLFGQADKDTLFGGMGDDHLDGGEGGDHLDGEEGDDRLVGGAGRNQLQGGEGNDILMAGNDGDVMLGGAGEDVLVGGDGDDYLYGDGDGSGDGADILEGGKGQDKLSGLGGADVYVFNVGDGQDTITDDGSDGTRNVVVFKFAPSQLRKVERRGVDLIIEYGTNDSVTAMGFYGRSAPGSADGAERVVVGPAQYSVAEVQFEDGTVWSSDDLLRMAPPPEPVDPGSDPFEATEGNYFVNALLDREEVRSAGKHQLTFGFATRFPTGVTGGMLFTEENKAAVRTALSRFSDVVDLQFVEVADYATADFSFYLDDLRSTNSGGFAGYASAGTGEIHLNSALYAEEFRLEEGGYGTRGSLAVGESGFETLLHEIGHALGLKHPFEQPMLPQAEDNRNNTVMSYTRSATPQINLQAFDVAALQYLYGVADNLNAGDNSYGLSTRFIQDASGADTLDFSAETEAVTVDLAPGSWIYRGTKSQSILAEGQAHISYGTVIENVVGGSGGDVLTGNDVANRIEGGIGEDSLRGGRGNDTLIGGEGADTYTFTVGDGRDVIVDGAANSRVILNGVTEGALFSGDDTVCFGFGNDQVQIALSEISALTVNGQTFTGGDIAAELAGKVSGAGDLILGEGDTKGRLIGQGDWTIAGNESANLLVGNDGNNTIIGGSGDDTVVGGAGRNEYRFATGDGNDTVLLTATEATVLAFENTDRAGLRVVRDGSNLILRHGAGDADSVVLRDTWVDGSVRGAISLRFADDSVVVMDTAFVLDALTIKGSEGNDADLSGTSGNDTIRANGGDDLVSGLAGNDLIFGGDGNDTLSGGDGNDTLEGGAGSNILDGGAGNDLIRSAGGSNTVLGGAGDDVIESSNSAITKVVLRQGDGNDTVRVLNGYSLSIEFADFASEEVTFSRKGNDLVLSYGLNGSDSLTIQNFWWGHEIVWAFIGNMEITKEVLATKLAIEGGGGDDVLRGDPENNPIYGYGGNDLLIGGLGGDLLDAGRGDDTLDGGLGDDLLVGYEGDDQYIFNVGDGHDHIFDSSESGTTLVIHGTTEQQLRFRRILGSGGVPDQLKLYYGPDSTDGILLERFYWDNRLVKEFDIVLDDGRRIHVDAQYAQDALSIRGSETADDVLSGNWLFQETLLGLGGDDRLLGTSNNDHLYGGLGNDTLEGGGGVDWLDGGEGDNLYVFNGSSTRATIQDSGTGGLRLRIHGVAAESIDLTRLEGELAVRYGDGAFVVLRGIWNGQSLSRPVAIELDDGVERTLPMDLPQSLLVIHGSEAPDVSLRTGPGADTVFGYGGSDVIGGGEGDDVIDGGDSADSLRGDGGDDLLIGGEGGDRLDGGWGNDTLEGGEGVDTMRGGAGDDTYVIHDDTDDIYELQPGYKYVAGGMELRTIELMGYDYPATIRMIPGFAEAERTGVPGVDYLVVAGGYMQIKPEHWTYAESEGVDSVLSHVSYSLGEGLENLTLLGANDLSGYGNQYRNTLTGNAGDNTLVGYVFNRAVDEFGIRSSNGRTLGVDFASAPDSSLEEDLRDRFRRVEFENFLTFEDVISRIVRLDGQPGDVLDGREGDDRLFGGLDDDTLLGGMGNDTLVGGGGSDVIVGGEGDDIYVIEHQGLLIDESANHAFWFLDPGHTELSESEDGGVDTVFTNQSYELAQYFENLVIFDELPREFENPTVRTTWGFNTVNAGGPSSAEGRGNSLANVIETRNVAAQLYGEGGDDHLIGSMGADVLDGGVGADLMEGGEGADHYWVDDVGDEVFGEESWSMPGDQVSTVLAFYQLPDGVEDLTLLADAPSEGWGNEAGNRIQGGSHNDRLLGFDGDDLLDGGSGADYLWGGGGWDSYIVDDVGDMVDESGGDGRDAVFTTLETYTLTDGVEDLYLELGVQGVGNELDNAISANDRDNLLIGLGGDDHLSGFGGVDTLIGGAGNDIYDAHVSSIGLEDVVIEAAGEGVDLINLSEHAALHTGGGRRTPSTITIDLPDAVEGLSAPGVEAAMLIRANAEDNVVTGGSGRDTVLAGEGDDMVSGDQLPVTNPWGPSVAPLQQALISDGVAQAVEEILRTTDFSPNPALRSWEAFVASWGLKSELSPEDQTWNYVAVEVAAEAVSGVMESTTWYWPVASWHWSEQVLPLSVSMDSSITLHEGADSLDFRALVERWFNRPDVYLSKLRETADVQVVDGSIALEGRVIVSSPTLPQWSGGLQGTLQWAISSLPSTWRELVEASEQQAYADELHGEAGSDTLYGGVGNDVVFGGDGDDHIYGGVGAFVTVASHHQLPEPDSEGAVQYASVLNHLAPDEHDTLRGGAGDDFVDGGAGNDLILGDDGNDYLYGGDDASASLGGGGIIVNSGNDAIGEPTMPVRYKAFSNDDLIDGGEGSDTIDGGSGNDTLRGGAGDDVVIGGNSGWINGSNDDILDGGEGLDTLIGGQGDDTYFVDGTFVVLNDREEGNRISLCSTEDRFGQDAAPSKIWASDTVIEQPYDGFDTVYSTASIIVDQVESVVLLDSAEHLHIDATTGEGEQYLVGNRGHNVLDGGAGADTMEGGAGDDTYRVDDEGDVIVEEAGSGFDVVRTGLNDFRLGEHLDGLVLEGAAVSGWGNDSDNYLVGNEEDNVLQGGAGNDTLAGWHGDDTLAGGAGNDVYVYSRGSGVDTVLDVEGDGVLRFSGDIAAGDLRYALSGDDLIVSVWSAGQPTNDQVVLKNWVGAQQRIQEVQFCAEPSVNIGNQEGKVSGFVFLDRDNDGSRAQEDGIAGVAVRLTGANGLGESVEIDALTDAQGYYEFANLGAGDYSIQVAHIDNLHDGKAVAGSAQALTGVNRIDHVNLIAGTTAAENNFGKLPFASLSGNVYIDSNGDGLRNEAEAGLPGVFLRLTGVDDLGAEVFAESVTNSAGAYVFAGLRPGSYTVSQTQPSEYLDGADQAGSAGGTVGNDVISGILLAPGQQSVDNNFGEWLMPVAMDDADSVREDDADPAVGNLLLNDQGVKLALRNPGVYQGEYGQLTVQADGSYSYVLDNGLAAVQSMGGGAALSETFGYDVSDGLAAASASLTITIHGTNDAPVAQNEVRDMQVGADTGLTGNVLLNDSDVDSGTVLSVGNPRSAAGLYGSLVLGVDGDYRYELDTTLDVVKNLAPGATLMDSFDYTVLDNDVVSPLSAAASLQIRIAGAAVGTGKLSGHVYLDEGDDGLRNSEPGIAGTLITLHGVDDLGRAVTATATTDAAGYYEFANLRAGQYDLAETQPVSYVDGKDTVGTGGGTVGADAITGIVLATGMHSQENNFGEQPVVQTGSIGDLVFLDCNNNGLKDAEEMGVAGVTVQLLNAVGAVLSSTVTDANGRYLFGDLSAGSYAVQVVAPAGYAYAKRDQGSDNTFDSDVDGSGKTATFTLDAGVSDLSWDAGLTGLPVKISYCFDGNSASDGADGNSRVYTDVATGVSVSATAWSRDKSLGSWAKAWLGAFAGGHGVTDSSEGSGSGTAHTIDNSGRDNFVVYQFSTKVTLDKAFLGYVSGDSDVTVWIGNTTVPITSMSNAVLSSLGFTEVNHGGGYTRWADLNATGIEGNVLVVAAKQGESNDYFKLQQLDVSAVPCAAPAKASLGSRVWCDTNGNGLQDVGEVGVAGVSVKLLDASNTVVATSTTNTNGDYVFAGLAPADYLVEFEKPAGYGGFTLAHQGSDDALDSDVNPTTGRTSLTTLVSGENDLSWDAGLTPISQVSTFAFGGRTAADGADGNTRTSTVDGITVTASAWSRDKSSGSWSKAWLGAYAGGYGVTDSSEGSGSGTAHTVDNSGRDNFLLYQFSDKVVVDKAHLGYVSGDSDISVWVGNYSGTISSMSNGVLTGLGFTEVNWGSGSARWADFNAAGLAGNTLVVSAKVGDSNDNFKIEKLVVSAPSKLVTPLVIDLGDDGIQTTALQASMGRFDLLGNGTAVHSGWISGDDAFLAVDNNGNGRIDDLSELFGGVAQGEAFAQLATLDDNLDGVVDASDVRFAELRVWRDLNQNHSTDEGELSTLSQAGVKSLSTVCVFEPVLDANGNLHGDTATATLVGGSQVAMSDLFFSVNPGDAAGLDLFTLNDLLAPTHTALPESAPELDNQVNSLVQALAAFAPAIAGDSAPVMGFQNNQTPLLAASLS